MITDDIPREGFPSMLQNRNSRHMYCGGLAPSDRLSLIVTTASTYFLQRITFDLFYPTTVSKNNQLWV